MAINPAIIGVAEIETCSYVLTVASTDLCAIPVLAPKKAIEASPIVCSPALSDESYQKYQDGISPIHLQLYFSSKEEGST